MITFLVGSCIAAIMLFTPGSFFLGCGILALFLLGVPYLVYKMLKVKVDECENEDDYINLVLGWIIFWFKILGLYILFHTHILLFIIVLAWWFIYEYRKSLREKDGEDEEDL